MIDIKIFEVERGFCAAIDTWDHHTMIIDCGYGAKFSPSEYISSRRCHSLDCLVVSAYTEDHLAGFPKILSHCWQHGLPINFLIFNPTVNPQQFSGLNIPDIHLNNTLNPIAYACQASGWSSQIMEINEIKLSFFWNNYQNFQAAHNLSLVTFVSYRDINMILPGDLETEGWSNLLQSPEFQEKLRRVNLFVASNHGQENGYCREVFDYCHPEVIIVSNKENKPISAQMMSKYQNHALGAPFGICKKKVLTTYDDGTITVSKHLDKLRQITTQPKSKYPVSLN